MRPTILLALLLALGIAGCGGESSEGTSAEPRPVVAAAPPRPESAAAADSICGQMIAKSGRLGAEFSAESDTSSGPLELTTRLMEPAIPIVERSARRLRALKAEAASTDFDAYVNLFDPILALLRERVAAGNAADGTRAHELEQQLVEMIALQRSLARQATLQTCDVDFIATFSSQGLTR
jgi:hypothetical protein